MFNWAIIGDKVFGILSSSGYNIQMRDKDGAATMDPHKAIRFLAVIPSKNPELKTFNILLGLHDEGSYSHLDFRSPKTLNEKDFETVTNLKNSIQKNLGDVEGLKINWMPFGSSISLKHDPIDKPEIDESKDIGRVWGTTKSSFQRVGESRIIIRHTDAIDESKKGSRWRRIRAVFVETKDGERFKYPANHVAGARAVARHLSSGGVWEDELYKKIVALTEDWLKLKKACKVLRSSGNADDASTVSYALKEINSKLKRISGPRGYRGANEIASIPLEEEEALTCANKWFAECSNNLSEDERDALNTAARYIVNIRVAGVDQSLPSWLAPILLRLSKILKEPEQQSYITGLLNNLTKGGKPTADDLGRITGYAREFVPIYESNELSRLKKLSGL